MPYSPLGKGFLTGTIDASAEFAANDIRNTIPRFAPEARKANQALVELTADDLRDIERVASQITVQGERYPEHLERLTNR